MPTSYVNQKNIAAFIYLMDKIFRKGLSENQITNTRVKIKEYTVDMSGAKTIDQTFKLWQYLKGAAEYPPYRTSPFGERVRTPSKRTLNAFTDYHTQGAETSFEDFSEMNAQLILAYYADNRPSDIALRKVCPPQHSKLTKLEKQMSALEKAKVFPLQLMIDVLGDKQEDWIKGLVKNGRTASVEDKLRGLLEEYIVELEHKVERARQMQALLGNFGLFFVTVPEFDEIKEEIAEVFKEEYEDDFDFTEKGDEDDVLDSIL